MRTPEQGQAAVAEERVDRRRNLGLPGQGTWAAGEDSADCHFCGALSRGPLAAAFARGKRMSGFAMGALRVHGFFVARAHRERGRVC